MAKKVFDSLNNRPVYKGQKMDDNTITEQHGYIPANKMIENLILAGKRLNAQRGIYDSDDGTSPENLNIDPTRKPGLDLADASILNRNAMERIEEQEEAVKASQTAQDESGGVKTPDPMVDTPPAK